MMDARYQPVRFASGLTAASGEPARDEAGLKPPAAWLLRHISTIHSGRNEL
jgi:hypothetical protein